MTRSSPTSQDRPRHRHVDRLVRQVDHKRPHRLVARDLARDLHRRRDTEDKHPERRTRQVVPDLERADQHRHQQRHHEIAPDHRPEEHRRRPLLPHLHQLLIRVPVQALPHLPTQRGVPHPAQHERRERRDNDREPVDRTHIDIHATSQEIDSNTFARSPVSRAPGLAQGQGSAP